MSSSYDYPENYIYWYLQGRLFGLVTTNTDSTDSSTEFSSIDESLKDAILIEYIGDPPLLNPEDKDIADQSLPCHPLLHSAILDYVKSQLYLEKPGGQEAQELMLKANLYYKKFESKVIRFNGGKPVMNFYKVKPDKKTSLR